MGQPLGQAFRTPARTVVLHMEVPGRRKEEGFVFMHSDHWNKIPRDGEGDVVKRAKPVFARPPSPIRAPSVTAAPLPPRYLLRHSGRQQMMVQVLGSL